jgi:DNA-binding transcriptional LysR family regulator
MEITDLRTFLEVASGKRITAAGRELNTVPSNVTTRIKKLEEEIGLPLFDRHSRGMILTEAGQRLLPYAENLVTLLREAKEAAQDNGVVRGALRIGSMETTAAVRLPPLLARFHRDCPQVKFTLVTGPTAHLIDEVVARRLDGAFVAGPIDHPDLEVMPAFSEELVLVTAAAIDSLEALRQSASGGLTALMFRLGCSYRQRLEQVLAGMGLPAFSRIELGTLDGLLGCIAAGIGVTLLPRAVVAGSNQAGGLRMHALPAGVGEVATLLAIRRDKRVGAALRSFIGIVDPVPGAAAA